MGAVTKKHRKHGRHKRKPSGGAQQTARTTRNKAKRMLHEERKAGRKLTWANSPALLALYSMR